MDFKAFTVEALKTESIPPKLDVNPAVLVIALEMTLATTDVLDLLKKKAFYGKMIDEEKLTERLEVISSCADMIQTLKEYAGESSEELVSPIINLNTGEQFKATDFPVRLSHGIIGAATEMGEIIKALLEHVVNGKPIDGVNLSEEFGDFDWYKAVTFEALNEIMGLTGTEDEITETMSRQRVLAKLVKRYQRKQQEKLAFNAEGAINRDTDAERQILEGN